jgi:hypothetical protein
MMPAMQNRERRFAQSKKDSVHELYVLGVDEDDHEETIVSVQTWAWSRADCFVKSVVQESFVFHPEKIGEGDEETGDTEERQCKVPRK